MRQNQIVTLLWVKWCMNFTDPKEFIKWICERTDKMFLYDHLLAKWNGEYKRVDSWGVMSVFYCDLDQDLRDALVEYAITIWAPHGMHTTFYDNADRLGVALDRNGVIIRKGDAVAWTNPETGICSEYEVTNYPKKSLVRFSDETGEYGDIPSELEVFARGPYSK